VPEDQITSLNAVTVGGDIFSAADTIIPLGYYGGLR
jgi:hypothetical protein